MYSISPHMGHICGVYVAYMRHISSMYVAHIREIYAHIRRIFAKYMPRICHILCHIYATFMPQICRMYCMPHICFVFHGADLFCGAGWAFSKANGSLEKTDAICYLISYRPSLVLACVRRGINLGFRKWCSQGDVSTFRDSFRGF